MILHLVPTDADELSKWLEDGTLAEGPALDFKREVGTTKRARRDLAKDVASMANNGGRLIIGVDKPSDGRPPTPRPTSLVGLAERVDQITRSRLDEPLVVATKEYPIDDEGNGFLLITVPPSPAAPHMVDGGYWGRSDVTNYPMPDAEVARLHRLRAERDRTAASLLQVEIERDPWPPRVQECGHLFVVAQPTTEDPERLLRAIDHDHHDWVTREIVNGAPCRACGSYWAPDLGQLTNHVWRRAGGWAATTYAFGPGRQIRDNGDQPARESSLLELEIREDGGLRLFCGGATDEQFAMEDLVAGLVKRVLLVARLITATTGYVGSWDLGVAITNVSGVITHRVRNWLTATRPPVYSENDYGETLRVSLAQLEEHADDIVGRLVGRFFRGLGREFDPEQLPI